MRNLLQEIKSENGHKYLPYIVLVIDEFADLIMTAGKRGGNPYCTIGSVSKSNWNSLNYCNTETV